MTSFFRHLTSFTTTAGLALGLCACSSSKTPTVGGGSLASGGATGAGGAAITGGSTATETAGGTTAAGGNTQSAGGSVTAGGTSGTRGASGGATATGGSPTTGGSSAQGGSSESGRIAGGTVSTGGRIGGVIAAGGTLAATSDAGTTGGATSSGGRTGTAGGGSMALGGTTGKGGAIATGGATTNVDGGLVSGVASFHCFNWADKGDNFQAGVLQPSGLSSSDSYATVKAKSDAILSGFQTVLNANAIRIPINESTIVTNPTWWTAYKAILDSAIAKNMKVIVAYWGQTGNNGGKPADVAVFYTMWQAVIDAYLSSDLVYFDIMNEPWAYSPTAFINFAAQWLAQFPTVPKNRVIVAGNYNDSDVNQQGADPRLAGCLLSLHAYPNSSKTNTTTEQGWRDYITTHVGPYYNRVIVTEWSGTPMSTGVDYSGAINGDVNKAYLVGVAGQIKDYGMGSCWWAGLETGNTYAIANVTGTGTNLSISVVNASGLARIQAAWGP